MDDVNTYTSFLTSEYTGEDFTEEIWIRTEGFADEDAILFHRENCYGIIISPAGLLSLQWSELTGALHTESTGYSLSLSTNTYISLIRDQSTQNFHLAIPWSTFAAYIHWYWSSRLVLFQKL